MRFCLFLFFAVSCKNSCRQPLLLLPISEHPDCLRQSKDHVYAVAMVLDADSRNGKFSPRLVRPQVSTHYMRYRAGILHITYHNAASNILLKIGKKHYSITLRIFPYRNRTAIKRNSGGRKLTLVAQVQVANHTSPHAQSWKGKATSIVGLIAPLDSPKTS